MISYISPSSLAMFYDNREKFYKRYLCYPREPRDPTSKPMLLGSAFDAYVKNALTSCIFGENVVQYGEPFHLQTLFNSQVEDCEHRTWAWETGKKLFDAYVETGAFAELLADVEGAEHPPEFEKEVNGVIEFPSGPVTIKGFIDCYYINAVGECVILDWKCNNYCAKSKQSPKKYYVRRRPAGTHHKKITPVNGMMPGDLCFSEVDRKWADQLTIYGWMMSCPDAIIQIEQLLCQPDEIETVTYRGLVSQKHKDELAQRIELMQRALTAGHIFTDMTYEESKEKEKSLQKYCEFLHLNPDMQRIIDGIRGK